MQKARHIWISAGSIGRVLPPGFGFVWSVRSVKPHQSFWGVSERTDSCFCKEGEREYTGPTTCESPEPLTVYFRLAGSRIPVPC